MTHEPESKVVFQPMGRRMTAAPQASLLELARRAGLALESPCGGKGLCGKCRVMPHGETSPLLPDEEALLGSEAKQGLRLACQTHMPQGGEVWVPEQSLGQQQVILTLADDPLDRLDLDPAVSLCSLAVEQPSLAEPEAAQERLFAALSLAMGPAPGQGFALPLGLLRDLPAILAAGQGRLDLALRQGEEIVGLWPQGKGRALGLAVDLGTTTVVAYLRDLCDGRLLGVSAAMNPQVPWGDDVISRIARCAQDPTALQNMSEAARRLLNRLAREACDQAGVDPACILECVMVGNPAMHHIFLGLDSACLAQAPFAPQARGALCCKARDLGLELAPEAWLSWLPLKAGFVGADILAAALAVDIQNSREPTLLLDLGTNGEMVLAAKGRMLACSTAAGPALEGGHISQGMRGAPGAVDRARLAPGGGSLDLRVIGGAPPIGLCGSGLVSIMACLLRAGILSGQGGLAPGQDPANPRQGGEGLEYLLAPGENTGHGRDLVLTAADVAQVQLAKAAIRAGAEVLMHEMGVKRLARVLLAGAFGNYLDPAEARRLGMFPYVPVEAIEGVGNAAGVGAMMALLSRAQRDRAQTLAQSIEYVELSGHPVFNELFVEHLFFPAA